TLDFLRWRRSQGRGRRKTPEQVPRHPVHRQIRRLRRKDRRDEELEGVAVVERARRVRIGLRQCVRDGAGPLASGLLRLARHRPARPRATSTHPRPQDGDAPMAGVDNAEVAARLHEWADHLQSTRANPYRVRTYHKAADTVAALTEPIEAWVREGRDLQSIAGIGESLSARIRAIVESGGTYDVDAGEHKAPSKGPTSGTAKPKGLAAQLRGDLHCHTNATDGAHGL